MARNQETSLMLPFFNHMDSEEGVYGFSIWISRKYEYLFGVMLETYF